MNNPFNLLSDMDELHDLILRYAKGETEVKQRRDALTGSVESRLVILGAMESAN